MENLAIGRMKEEEKRSFFIEFREIRRREADYSATIFTILNVLRRTRFWVLLIVCNCPSGLAGTIIFRHLKTTHKNLRGLNQTDPLWLTPFPHLINLPNGSLNNPPVQ